jgi:hypothetical protein
MDAQSNTGDKIRRRNDPEGNQGAKWSQTTDISLFHNDRGCQYVSQSSLLPPVEWPTAIPRKDIPGITLASNPSMC